MLGRIWWWKFWTDHSKPAFAKSIFLFKSLTFCSQGLWHCALLLSSQLCKDGRRPTEGNGRVNHPKRIPTRYLFFSQGTYHSFWGPSSWKPTSKLDKDQVLIHPMIGYCYSRSVSHT
jgi:hypothetical protein